MNLSRISKRIGLGDTEEFYGQSSLESLIKNSLDTPVLFKALPSLHGTLDIWPSEKEFNLNQRIKRLVKRRTQSDAIDNGNLSDQEREIAR